MNRQIEDAPINEAIMLHVPNMDYYGNNGWYAGMRIDMGTGERWYTFGYAIGRDLDVVPDGWLPMPNPTTPQEE